MKECIDITEHYLNISTPGFGEIIKQEGYNDSLHSNEISMAKLIINTLGGDVVLLNEKNLDNVKTPDFLWHDKHWDLKDVSSLKAVDNAVRKGLRQIKDNPGGIILDFGKKEIKLNEVKKCLEDRLRRGFPSSVDFILIARDTIIAVFRYKK
ncbi:MAG: hypothetical protein IKO16_06355 [Lachnospiraceae bacterium]|nr:hypothetical protein [Lachnospiraceae bacterium]